MGISDLLIEYEERGYGAAPGVLCASHITDSALRDQLQPVASDLGDPCLLCGLTDVDTVGLEELVERVMVAVRYFYQPAVEILPYDSREGGYQGPVEDTSDVLRELGLREAFESNVAEQAFDHLVSIVADQAWTVMGTPGEPEGVLWEWRYFAHTVKHSARFVFSPSTGSSEHVGGFLARLTQAYTADPLGIFTHWKAGTSVFRGRIVSSFGDEKVWDAGTLGPQTGWGAKANRMSPAGISMFYGSLDPQTVIAEISHTSNQTRAVVGEFRLTTGIHVLDLTRIPRFITGSKFDPKIRELITMRGFLKDFVAEVSRPVIPDGREHFEYAPTQVLTEFLRYHSGTALVAIAFPSSLINHPTENADIQIVPTSNPPSVPTPGTNVVLFYDRDQVCNLGTEQTQHMMTLAQDDVTFYNVHRRPAYGTITDRPAGRPSSADDS